MSETSRRRTTSRLVSGRPTESRLSPLREDTDTQTALGPSTAGTLSRLKDTLETGKDLRGPVSRDQNGGGTLLVRPPNLRPKNSKVPPRAPTVLKAD